MAFQLGQSLKNRAALERPRKGIQPMETPSRTVALLPSPRAMERRPMSRKTRTALHCAAAKNSRGVADQSR